MVYLPEKNNIRKIISVALLLIDVLLVLLFISMENTRIRGIITFLFLLINLYGIYYLVLIITLKYKLDEKEFVIANGFEFKTVRIPIQEIESWSRRITLLDTVGMGLSTARFALGKGTDNTGKQADLYITSSKKVIYLRTTIGNFGISPADADGFTDHLKRLDILPQKLTERSYIANDGNKDRSMLNLMMLYCIILTSILLSIPLALYFSDFMPSLVKISSNSWISRSAYLETVFTRGLMALILILFSYGVTVLLSSIEGRYYYRNMFIPLAIIVILLFMEINTQLSSLLGGGLLLYM